MPTDIAVELARRTFEAAVWLVAPLLIVATLVSLVINLAQVLTSLQDTTLSTVPRLAAVAVAVFSSCPGWCIAWARLRWRCFPISARTCASWGKKFGGI